MARYLDHHKMPGPPSSEMIQQTRQAIRAGQADPATGVKGLNWFWTNKEAWCLTDAPNAQAVHKYHESMGIKLGLGDVAGVQSAV